MGEICCYEECKECENLYHCFGPKDARLILQGDPEDIRTYPCTCRDYYPEVIA